MAEYSDREGKFMDWLHDERQKVIEELREANGEDPGCYAAGYETGRLHALDAVFHELRKLLSDPQ